MVEVLTDKYEPIYFDNHQRAPSSRPPHLFSLIGLMSSYLYLGKMLKIRTPKETFSKLAPPLSATNVKIMGMLLSIVPAHLRFHH